MSSSFFSSSPFRSLVTKCGSVVSARREIRWLCESLFNSHEAISDFKLNEFVDALSSKQKLSLDNLVHRRSVEHEPLSYLIGEHPFLSLPLAIRRPILIPRPETEQWTSWTLNRIQKCDYRSRFAHGGIYPFDATEMSPTSQVVNHKPKNPGHSTQPFRVLDVCSGSGAIGLAFWHYGRCNVLGLDKSLEAVRLSRDNITKISQTKQISLSNKAAAQTGNASCAFECLDVLHPHPSSLSFSASTSSSSSSDSDAVSSSSSNSSPNFLASFLKQHLNWHDTDLIVSNPPYLSEQEFGQLMEDVRLHEEMQALVGAHGGKIFYEFLAAQASALLPPLHSASIRFLDRPEIVLEIGGSHQCDAVFNLLSAHFQHITIHKDLNDKIRFIAASRTHALAEK